MNIITIYKFQNKYEIELNILGVIELLLLPIIVYGILLNILMIIS